MEVGRNWKAGEGGKKQTKGNNTAKRWSGFWFTVFCEKEAC